MAAAVQEEEEEYHRSVHFAGTKWLFAPCTSRAKTISGNKSEAVRMPRRPACAGDVETATGLQTPPFVANANDAFIR